MIDKAVMLNRIEYHQDELRQILLLIDNPRPEEKHIFELKALVESFLNRLNDLAKLCVRS
jgi:hypothetical protein